MAKRSVSNISTTNYNEFLRVIRGETTTNQKFKLTRTQQTFVIENIDSVDDPNKLLRACFQHSMDWTLQMSRDVNMECDTI